MSDFKLGDIQGSTSGLDAFFETTPQIVTPTKVASGPVQLPAKPARVKVASLDQLSAFTRVSAEALIHKSNQDLWTLKREGNDYYIERLFQDGDPLKG